MESGPRILAALFALIFIILVGQEIKSNFMAVFLKLGFLGSMQCSKMSINSQGGASDRYNFLTFLKVEETEAQRRNVTFSKPVS